MMHSTLFAIFAFLSLVSAIPTTLTSRNPANDPLYVQYWESGCDVAESGRQTHVISDEGPDYPGDCFAIPNFGWKSIKITQDSAASYSIDLFSGLGCNNPIITVTENGCYTQPEGQIVQSARANKK